MTREVIVGEPMPRRLLRAQFPQWGDLPLEQVTSAGTDNTLFRLGDELVVRLPRMEWAIEQVSKEQLWLPRLAPSLPLQIPVPVAEGRASDEYPWTWSILQWLEGETISSGAAAQPAGLAAGLAVFVRALQSVDAAGAPRWGAQTTTAVLHS